MNMTMIAKHLGNELTELEKKQFSEWLAVSDENRKELANAKKIWLNSNIIDNERFNPDNGWKAINQRIKANKIVALPNNSIFTTWMKIAASLVLLTGLAFAITRIVESRKYIEIKTGNEKIVNAITLPDGTKVYLNAGSTLKYPKIFTGNTRLVELTGEGFFEVLRNKNVPFVIQTEKAFVKVLGTSFNVAAYSKTDSVQVVVETGTVQLSAITNTITLTLGNTGVYRASENKLVKTNYLDVNNFAWRTNNLVFKNSELPYVINTLNRVYRQSITLEGNYLNECRLNANFKNQDFEHILETIKTTLNLEINKHNNGYIISGAGC